MTRWSRHVAGLLVVPVVMTGIAGCVRAERAPASPTTEVRTAAPDAASADRAALSVVVEYVRVLGDVMRSADVPISSLEAVASGNLLKSDLHVYGGTRGFGTFERGGRAQVLDAVVVRRDLDNADPSVAGGRPYVVVEGCRDTTAVRVFNTRGKQPSVPFPPLPGRYQHRFTVVLTADGWRVDSRENLGVPGEC